jgi:hypothetical protein
LIVHEYLWMNDHLVEFYDHQFHRFYWVERFE